jgi:hypothetical protein
MFITPERTLGTFNLTDELDLRLSPQPTSLSALDKLTAQYAARVYRAGNVPCALYHCGRYHLRHKTGFSDFFKKSLADYKAAWLKDRTLTRVQFWQSYKDHIAAFLSTYMVDERPISTDAAEIEWTTLRALISIVAPERVKYSAQFDDFLSLEEKAAENYYRLRGARAGI